MTTTVRAATIELLRKLGMNTIFGNPGSTELPMFRDWPSDFRYVLGLQESVVLAMADGYAQATRNAAFVNLHSSAGTGHALGNLFTAFRNRTPLVVTAGQQARGILLRDPFLFAQQAAEFPKPFVKWSIEPARAEDVPAAIARAYYIAMQAPQGPTFVSVPVDDWDRECEHVEPRDVSRRLRADPLKLAPLADALHDASRPAFVVGAGIDRDSAVAQVVELAERHKAAIWVSPLSARCSFPERHPLFAGFLPAHRHEIVRRLEGHDVVVALGAPIFTYHTEGEGPYVPAGARFFQVSDDPDMNSWAVAGSSIVSSLDLALADLLADPRPAPDRQSPPPRAPRPEPKASSPMSPEFVMHTVSKVLPKDAIVVEEAPGSRTPMHNYLPLDGAEKFYTCASGGLGHGLPAAVGVALGKPGTRIVALIGDGSSMYAIQALWSAAQLALPITIVIFNNGQYTALKHFMEHFGIGASVGCDLPGIDFVKIAEGQGCRAQRVTDPSKLADALVATFSVPTPTLIEVDVQGV